MEYIKEEDVENLKGKILCCHCGVSIEPNPANMCVGCLRSEVDITEGIPKQATIHFCRGCERYLQHPVDWIHCSLESRELLALCLRKLKGLNRVKLIDAGFIWTEPHSKRIKVKLIVQGELAGGTILQQEFVVEYTVAHQMCDDCHRTEAQNFWRAVVQVRQKTQNKKTFYYLEQLILKHKAHENTLGIKQIHEGLDFFYANEAHARRFLDFLNSVLPVRYQHSKKLLSHDIHSNVYNYKFTFSVEIVPVSKDSIVCLPKKVANHLGGINQLCLVQRVTNAIHLIDPTTAQIAEINGSNYWRDPFNSVFDPKQLTEYTVMDVEPIFNKKNFPGQGQVSNKHILADMWVVKTSELGVTENTIHTRSHLGHILKPGDSVLGYNLCESNVNDENFDTINKDNIPDVLLVKKFYGTRNRKRIWKLKRLAKDDDGSVTSSANRDYTSFLDDLEEDPLYRQNVNIYKARSRQPELAVDTNDMEDPDEPKITLEEMLDDLNIEDA